MKPWLVCFLCFLTCLLLPVSALTGVTVGTSTSAVADIASANSRIANLLMRSPEVIGADAEAHGWYAPREQTFPWRLHQVVILCRPR